jgi:uncharacterized protein
LQHSTKNTAILFFSKTAKFESKGKKITSSRRATEAVTTVFIQKTRQILRGLDVPIFSFSEENQRGNCFGERLQNAFSDVFEQGFQQVIAIGNDCLDLNETHIVQAIDGLKKGPSIFGATTDGGVYLLGLRKDFFNDFDLKNIAWQTDKVFSELTQLVDNQYIALEILSDIDNANDLILFLKKTTQSLKKILIALLKKQEPKPLISVKNYIRQYLLSIKLLRAPPVFFN